MRNEFLPFLLAALTGLAGTAAAGECQGIASDTARLACYDESAGWVEASGRVHPVWAVEETTSALSGTPTVVLSVPAEAAVMCSFGREEVPRLVLRCEEDTTSLAIETEGCHVTSGPFTKDGEVALRLDDGPAERRDFGASENNRALGIWDAKAIPIIREMMGHEALVARFTPFQRRPVTPRFHIAGLEQAIAPLRAACGW